MTLILKLDIGIMVTCLFTKIAKNKVSGAKGLKVTWEEGQTDG